MSLAMSHCRSKDVKKIIAITLNLHIAWIQGKTRDCKMDNLRENFLLHVGWDHQGSLLNNLHVEHLIIYCYFYWRIVDLQCLTINIIKDYHCNFSCCPFVLFYSSNLNFISEIFKMLFSETCKISVCFSCLPISFKSF